MVDDRPVRDSTEATCCVGVRVGEAAIGVAVVGDDGVAGRVIGLHENCWWWSKKVWSIGWSDRAPGCSSKCEQAGARCGDDSCGKTQTATFAHSGVPLSLTALSPHQSPRVGNAL